MLLSNPILIKFSAAAAQCMNWALVFNLWPFWIIKMHSKELMLLFFSGKTEPSTAADPPMDKTTVFYIAVGVACGIILIMALAVAAIHVHSMPSPNKEGLVMYVMFIVRACLLCLALTTCTEYIAQIIRRQIAMQQMGYSSQNLQPLNSQAQIFDLLLPLHPDFQNCLSFPPLGFPGSKNSPPPPHTHTHTYPSGLCNLFKCAACGSRGGKNEVNFLLFPVIHSTLEDVKFKQKLYTHLHLIWTKTLFLVNASTFFPLCLQWNWWWRWTS